jgi:hypothetical protein
MLVDKHEADNIFERIPGLTFKMSPELTAIDKVLADDALFCMIRDDLAQRYPKTLTAGGSRPRWRSSCACWPSNTCTT